MKGKVKCTCGWSWNKSDSSKKDMYICHECGRDNSNNMKNGGWMDNYNDSKASAPEGMVGDGFSNVGRNYSPAWGGQFEDGGEIPMAQNGTRADSLALYNNALAKIKFYKGNPDYVQRPSATNFKSGEVRKNLIKLNKNVPNKKIKKEFVDSLIQNTEDENKPLTPAEKSAIRNQSNIVKFGPVRGTNLTSFGDILGGTPDTYFNPLAPPIYLHPNISPQGSEKYYSRRFGDSTDIPYYDPIAVAPFDIVKNNPKLLAERIKKYGTSGVPKSYLDKIKPEDKTDKTDKQRPKVEALQPLTPQPVISNLFSDAKLPVIRPEVRIPKYYDVDFQAHNIPGGRMTFHDRHEGTEQMSLEELTKWLRLQELMNQGYDERYRWDNLSERFPNHPQEWIDKQTEKLKAERAALDVKLTATPRYQMGGNVYPVNYVPQAAMGASIPGSPGFSYARTIDPAPSEGPYAKKTMASAQDGVVFDKNGKRVFPNNRALQILADVWERKQKGIPSPQFSNIKIKDERAEAIKPADNTRTASKPKVTDIKKLSVRNKTEAELAEIKRKNNEAIAAERKAVREKADANVLNQWSTELFDSDNWTRQNLEDAGAGLESKFRLSDEPNFFDDYINIPAWVGRGAANLGAAPNQIVQQDSMMPLISAIAEPLVTGAIGPIVGPYISKASKAITYPIVAPIKRSAIVRNISPMIKPLIPKEGVIGKIAKEVNINRNLNKIKKQGKSQGLNDYEIARNQMEQIGITSNQRKGYTPIISELAEKYVTPHGYIGNDGKSKLSQIIQNIKQGGVDHKYIRPERSDAWRLYLGRPQLNKTFSLSDTAPVLHPSYKPGSLGGMDIYNINSKSILDDVTPKLDDYFYQKERMALLDNPISISREPAIMGGYNKVMTKQGTQYNDIWDLDVPVSYKSLFPNKISENPMFENIFYKTLPDGSQAPKAFKIPVEKFVGKPFMSHGNLPYTSTNYVNGLRNELLEKLANLNKRIGPNEIRPTLNEERWLQELKNLESYPKFKQGGIIKDDRGQWAHPGEITEIGSNNITMQGVPYPVLGISNTGDIQMMYPGEDYEYDGESVTEFPMAKNGLRQEQKGLQNLDNLLNFTNYNKPQPGGWLSKYK